MLEELNLAATADPLRYYINVTTGESISIGAFDSGGRFLQVKASEFVNLEREYRCYQRAWSDFPDFVPLPLGYAERETWSVIVSKGVRHTSFPRALVRNSNQHSARQITDLMRFFQITHKHTLPSSVAPHATLLNEIASHFESTPHAALVSHWISYAQHHGAQLIPESPQHGDFVLNNLASSNGRLVIFDWEDYGTINLQGLDLATLCISVWGESPAMIRAMMDINAKLDPATDAFIRTACAQAGIACDLFRRQMPLYLLIFFYLKRNYGESVQQRLGTLLQELLV